MQRERILLGPVLARYRREWRLMSSYASARKPLTN